MERAPVKGSSMISSAGYDGKTRTLEIEFSSGGVYSYEDVPPDVVLSFRRSESKGKYFKGNIQNKFKATKHDDAT